MTVGMNGKRKISLRRKKVKCDGHRLAATRADVAAVYDRRHEWEKED
jgi:hypothetical protein